MTKTEADSAKTRCGWCLKTPTYIDYHDREWGLPVHDERKLFEFLTLESAQAGLSWLTILQKRENYREAFSDFDPEKVAKFTDKKIEQLLSNPGIVRNRQKVVAAVTNARLFLDIQKEFGSFDKYSWAFVGGKPIVNRRKSLLEVPATTAESDFFSKDLKKRGFKFTGSTIIYAHMQATGMVNDHLITCFRYHEIQSRTKI